MANQGKSNNLDDLNLKVDTSNLVEVFQKDKVLESSKSTKTKNIKFYRFLESGAKDKINMTDKIFDRIGSCGDFLQFLGDHNLEHIKLENANFCGNRFCPQCSANKAREDAIKIATISEYISQELGYEFLFLTLTAPNIRADEVALELESYAKSFKRLTETKAFKSISKGYVRKLEMTYNKKTNSYHPHYHIMLAVSPSYFTQGSQYLSQQKWLEMWRKAKRDEDITQVDIRRFRDLGDRFKAIFEISKYVSKDSDYTHNSDVFAVFYKNLKNKRLLSFNGCFKDAVKLYKAGDLEKYMGEDPNLSIEYIYRVWYSWDSESSKYDEVQKELLTPEEKQKANLSRAEKVKLKKQLQNEIKELNQRESAIRKANLEKSRLSRTKTKDLKTGEMELSPDDKKQARLSYERFKFEKLVDEFNKKQELKLGN